MALETGHEIAEMVPSADNTPEHRALRRHIARVEHLQPAAAEQPHEVLRLIQAGEANTEGLMQGAQLCYDLFGQHLFTHLTDIIDSQAPAPSEVHRAIAELAHASPSLSADRDRSPGGMLSFTRSG